MTYSKDTLSSAPYSHSGPGRSLPGEGLQQCKSLSHWQGACSRPSLPQKWVALAREDAWLRWVGDALVLAHPYYGLCQMENPVVHLAEINGACHGRGNDPSSLCLYKRFHWYREVWLVLACPNSVNQTYRLTGNITAWRLYCCDGSSPLEISRPGSPV